MKNELFQIRVSYVEADLINFFLIDTFISGSYIMYGTEFKEKLETTVSSIVSYTDAFKHGIISYIDFEFHISEIIIMFYYISSKGKDYHGLYTQLSEIIDKFSEEDIIDIVFNDIFVNNLSVKITGNKLEDDDLFQFTVMRLQDSDRTMILNVLEEIKSYLQETKENDIILSYIESVFQILSIGYPTGNSNSLPINAILIINEYLCSFSEPESKYTNIPTDLLDFMAMVMNDMNSQLAGIEDKFQMRFGDIFSGKKISKNILSKTSQADIL